MKGYLRRMIYVALALPILAFAQATEETSQILQEAETLVQARAYDAAHAKLTTYLKAKDPVAKAYGIYLQALVRYHQKQDDAAIAHCTDVITNHPTSQWNRKARFLQAKLLIRQKRHQEANAVYEAEANRLLAGERKERIAQLLVGFADDLSRIPKDEELDAPPPNHQKAHALYSKVLEMAIGRELRDHVQFHAARALQLQNQNGQAENAYRAYLKAFDPNWSGPVGSPERFRGQLGKLDGDPGKYWREARFYLIEVQLAQCGQRVVVKKGLRHQAFHADSSVHAHLPRLQVARQNVEDLIALLEKDGKAHAGMLADAHWTRVRTYNPPHPALVERDRAIDAMRAFIKTFPRHPRATDTSRLIAKTYQTSGRIDDAISAYRDFSKGNNYQWVPEDGKVDPKIKTGKSCAFTLDKWKKESVYLIGTLRRQQNNYREAIKEWEIYIAQFPNGEHWSACQNGIIEAKYQIGLGFVSEHKYADARKQFSTFLKEHPLDTRSRQIMFILGQMEVAEAENMEKSEDGKPNKKKIESQYRKAIDQWSRLISKYPNTEEASLALFRTAYIQESKLKELDQALASYMRLNWGSWAAQASQNTKRLTDHFLHIETERTFRTNEQPVVKIDTRNVKKVKVSQYFVNLDAYFRKTHRINEVEKLDVDLIEPDKTWEVEIDAYAKYRPCEQLLEIPFEDGKPGACIIRVSEEDWEATTLVLRSDYELILKASRREALVYVQDGLANKPAAGADVLLTDGKKVIATGTTGPDGVFRTQVEALKDKDDVRVFVSGKQGIASNSLSIAGMQTATGLSAKGYVYTNKPTYRPGETVSFRAILRLVKDGQYAVPADKPFIVQIHNPKSRLIWEREINANEFGTINDELTLGKDAPVGNYIIKVIDKNKKSRVFSGAFQLQRYKLENIKADIAFSKPVYFRGETIKATVSVAYYWGSPVADKLITYELPDGRRFSERTDKEGKLIINYDSKGFQPGSWLSFKATVDGENVATQKSALLAANGFNLSVKAMQPVAMSGEPVVVELEAKDPNGEPVARDLVLTVLHRPTRKRDPVLSMVPWLSGQLSWISTAETEISQHKIKTDKDTGKATTTLKLEKGGKYTLRVMSIDRFGQTISASNSLNVSDDKDAVKLRFFVDQVTYKVGEEIPVRLHSRINKGLALLTIEGEAIIEHKVIEIKKGYNKLPVSVENKHFPNFRIAIAAIDGRDLRTAQKEFLIKRELLVSVTPKNRIDAPGSTAEFDVLATDQLGKPVEAELSLAFVNEALFSLYADTRQAVIPFFQGAQRRYAGFRVGTTAGFSYTGAKKQVEKSIEEEKRRRETQQKERQRLVQAQQSGYRYGGAELAQRIAPQSANDVTNGTFAFSNSLNAQTITLNGNLNLDENMSMQMLQRELQIANTPALKQVGGINAKPNGPNVTVNTVAPRWFAPVRTDKAGKATLSIELPTTSGEWRITSVGCTVNTLVGEHKTSVITRKDFFVELKLPNQVQEKDELAVVARIHNMTKYAGPVELELMVNGAKKSTRALEVDGQSVTEVTLDGFTVGANEALQLEARIKGGKYADVLTARLPIRPWGLPYRSRAGGTSQNSETIEVALPDQAYHWQQLVVSLSPRLDQALLDMALQAQPSIAIVGDGPAETRVLPHAGSGSVAGDLLAAVSGLQYGASRKIDATTAQALQRRARTLAASLVASQRDDGGWNYSGSADLSVTCRTFWALAAAKRAGIQLQADTLSKAKTYLMNAFRRLGSNDYAHKAQVMFALSFNDAADFSAVNRLYRERNALDVTSLARLAVVFHHLKRTDTANELLAILEGKGKSSTIADRKLFYWETTGHRWNQNAVETSAIALLAYAGVGSESARAQQIADWLLQQKGCFSFRTDRALGPVVASLAAHFDRIDLDNADYEIEIFVNDKSFKNLTSKAVTNTQYFAVPNALIAANNRIRFEVKGNGYFHYAATLTGFSAAMKNPNSWGGNMRVQSRRYYHDRLRYRNVPLNALSTTQIKNLEVGQRTRVVVDLYRNSRVKEYLVHEEYLPSGMLLVEGSLRYNNAKRVEVEDGKITLYYPYSAYPSDLTYELVAYAPGTYQVLPTVISDALNPTRMVLGKTATLTVLPSGEKSKDPYNMNHSEHYELATKKFKDGAYDGALTHLNVLFEKYRNHYERDVARMMLWIYTRDDFFDQKKVVDMFEILRERHPDLYIPFDKILVVGKSYRLIGEHERAWLVFRATIDSSFVKDTEISAVLEDQGQFLGSMDYLKNLWFEYPDRATVVTSYFAWANALFTKAPEADKLAEQDRGLRRLQAARNPNAEGEKEPTPDKVTMLLESARMTRLFLTLFPEDPQADDAAFSLVNTFFALEDYSRVVESAERFSNWHKESTFKSSFDYMAALGHFWQYHYEVALKSAIGVANGESKDREYAQYITAQIYHTQGNPKGAIEWYEKVKDTYPDAAQAIDYFEEQKVKMKEVNSFKPGEDVTINIDYRNIKEAYFQVYKVDLMKLYLREKNLSNITQVRLAGIAPELELKTVLGDGKDYRDKEKKVSLNLKEEGAYLVICRGDDLFTSGLVLITPLKMEIQEDKVSGSLRVNILDRVKGTYVPKVHVKAIGNQDSAFKSGDTDLRGIFAVDGLNGLPTVIARADESRYAFYRGATHLGQSGRQAGSLNRSQGRKPMQQQLEINDYLRNATKDNMDQNGINIQLWDSMRRGGKGKKGVQIKYAK